MNCKFHAYLEDIKKFDENRGRVEGEIERVSAKYH